MIEIEWTKELLSLSMLSEGVFEPWPPAILYCQCIHNSMYSSLFYVNPLNLIKMPINC
jgi:hypothetical protein